MPLFSIIVPVYNVEFYLNQCIESILCQSFSDFEIVLVDDGSTDSSGNICDFYNSNYDFVKVIHKDNGGLSDARNFGVNIASGQYITFVDSDDIISQDYLLTFYDKICISPQLEIITPLSFLQFTDINQIPFAFPTVSHDLIGTGEYLLEKILLLNIDCWSGCGKCFLSRFWTDNNFSFKVNRLAEDLELIYKIILKASFVSTCNTVYAYRVFRDASITTSPKPKLIFDGILNIKEWILFLHVSHINKTLKLLLLKRFSSLYCTSILALIAYFPNEQRTSMITAASELRPLLIHGGFLPKLVSILLSLFGYEFTCEILAFFRKLKKKHDKYKLFNLKG